MNTKMTQTQLMENGLPGNLHNAYQGKYKRVLCVCTGGILRSATAAEVLSHSYNCNTRACGIRGDLSLVPISRRLVEWADEIVCFEPWHCEALRTMTDKPIYCLGIDDGYAFRDADLIELIRMRLMLTKFTP
jgi:predicted protein tyrosine phosphatase